MVERNPHAIIKLGSRSFDSWRDKQIIQSVEVELATDLSSEATVKLFDPKFRIIDSLTSGDGVPRLPVLIWLGFGLDLGKPVFEGLLDRVHRDSKDSHFIVGDMGLKMRQERKGEYHNSLDDLSILRKLATRNGLNFVGPDSAVKLDKHEVMIQDSRNDWEHAAERARASAFNIWVRGNTFYAKEPAKIGSPLLALTYRKDFVLLHDLDMTYKLPENRDGKPKVVEYRGRKRGGGRLTGKSSTHARGTKPKQFTRDLAKHTKTYADRRAHAHKELQREHAFNCTIRSIPPLPRVRPDVRDTIVLKEAGKLFSGPYLCDKVRHRYTPGTFTTEYALYRDTRG